MQNIGAGAGSAGTGGGTSGTGGGTSGTGGGTSGTGGGTSGTGGGTSSTGGGTSGTGGGTSGTGGGTSGTGGGTSGTGGGSATGATAFCNRLLAAQTRFFAGRSSCASGTITITPRFNLSACVATWNVCTETDRGFLDQIASCMENAQICSSGNESMATGGFLQCLSLSEALSSTCASSLSSP